MTLALFSWLLALPLAHGGDKPILRLDTGGPMAVVSALAFSPGGRLLYGASHDKTVQVWDTGTGERVRVLRGWIGKGHEGKLFALDASPDGRFLAVGGWLKGTSGQHQIRVLDPVSGAVIALLKGHSNVVINLKFSPDARYLASASYDKTVRVWGLGPRDLARGQALQTLEGHTDHIYGLAWAPVKDRTYRLASAAHDGRLILWDPLEGRKLDSVQASRGKGLRCAFSPDGRWVATGAYDGKVKLWDARGLKEVRTVARVGKGDLFSVAFAPNRQSAIGNPKSQIPPLLACGGAYSQFHGGQWLRPVYLHDAGSGARPRTLWAHTNTVMAIAFAPTAWPLAASSGGDGNECFLWDASTAEVRRRLAGAGKAVFACAFGRDGQSIYWGNVNQGGAIKAENPITRGFSLSGFHPLDRAAVSEARYHRVIHHVRGKIIECEGIPYRPEITIAGHNIRWPKTNDAIECFTFTPDGRAAVVGSNFALLRFDPRTGKQTGEFVGHEGAVWAVSVSPDLPAAPGPAQAGRGRLLSASHDQTLKLWDVATTELIASFFFSSEGEWVVWTPSGYYASSARGGRFIGWHLNRGEDQAADYFPASDYAAIYDRPDVVRATLRLGSEALGLKVANQSARRKKVTLSPDQLKNVPRPAITFLRPREGSETESPSIVVEYRVQSARRLESERVSVNGRDLSSDRGLAGVAKPTTGTRKVAVALDAGVNRITVSAAHALARAESTLRVYRKAAKPPAEVLHRLFLVCVGVHRYDHLPDKSQLDYADEDARAVAQVFKGLEGKLFRKVHARVLAGPGSDGNATRNEVVDALDLFARAGQYDTCLLFVAGHGITDPRGSFFFVPQDGRFKADSSPRTSSLVRWSTFKDALDVPGRKIMLVDTCHAAAAGGLKKRSVNNDELAKVLFDETTVVLTSCRAGESSQESREWGHGAFTKCLLDGLCEMKADLIKDGQVKMKELDTYVSEAVPKLSTGAQHPITLAPRGYDNYTIYKE